MYSTQFLSLKLVDRHFDLHYLSLKNDFSLYSKIINALSILSEKKITGMKLRIQSLRVSITFILRSLHRNRPQLRVLIVAKDI